ncbi:hypothetical protein AAFX19_05560 [Vibrio harveyi]|uniref:hypothetical protein n=1 Tax=Vibrio harveyi TaxID=669 RepID=UPI0038CD86CC
MIDSVFQLFGFESFKAFEAWTLTQQALDRLPVFLFFAVIVLFLVVYLRLVFFLPKS